MSDKPIDTTVVEALKKLHPDEIPTHLMQPDPVRLPSDFDPNAYFEVLTSLLILPGYTLDYFYEYTGHEGCPRLYARELKEKPIDSIADYRRWYMDNDIFEFLETDESPDGFFQLAVFRQLAEQFYLHWHAGYNDTVILSTPESVDKLIADARSEYCDFPEELIARIKQIDVRPSFKMDDDLAQATYCAFTKWGGLTRITDSFCCDIPYTLEYSEVIDVIEYDCRIVF